MRNNSREQLGDICGLKIRNNVAAMLSAAIPLVLSFVPYVSYFGWIVPLIMLVFENKSRFVRVCAAEAFALQAILALASALVKLIDKIDATSSIFPVLNVAFAALIVVCMVFTVLIAINGYSLRETKVPVIDRAVNCIIK